jgi:hypothetical protein
MLPEPTTATARPPTLVLEPLRLILELHRRTSHSDSAKSPQTNGAIETSAPLATTNPPAAPNRKPRPG